MTLAEKIWGSSIGAFIAYGKTAAAAALKPLLVTDNGDGTGTLVVSASSSALPTGAATAANQYANLTYKGQDRTTTTGAAEEITIPSGSKIVILSCASGSQASVDINANADGSADPLYFEDPFPPQIMPLGGVTKLSVWVVAGSIGAVFFG